jgi:hypothetical protein
MHFSALTFQDHAIAGATKARHTFPNGWAVSVVSGPEDSGLYGDIKGDTFEVAVIRPGGIMMEDVLPWQTPVPLVLRALVVQTLLPLLTTQLVKVTHNILTTYIHLDPQTTPLVLTTSLYYLYAYPLQYLLV